MLSSLGFLVSYSPQQPLFYSNQNTYLLHGLASAGYGFLQFDWLANTKDPFPIFSFFIKVIYLLGGKFLFLILFWIFLLIYFWSLFGIIVKTLNIRSYHSKFILSLVIIFLHSSVLLSNSKTYLGTNLVSFFNDGLANQYLVGSAFQPSIFGVFVLVSIYFFIKEKQKLSFFFLAVAVYFHTSYLLVSILILSGYVTHLILSTRNFKLILKIVLFYFLLIIPIVLYYYSFTQDSEFSRNYAQEILYKYRIPQHANIRYWINVESFLKLALILFSGLLVIKKKIMPVLFIPVTIAVVLSILQYWSDNAILGILFPWRVSVVLLPLSSVIVISYLMIKLKFLVNRNLMPYLSFPVLSLIFLISIYGSKANYHVFSKRIPSEINDVYNYIDSTKKKNDLLFIPIELEDFRLETGVPIFVDWKSHPYKPTELVEWYERIKIAKQVIRPDSTINTAVLSKLVKEYKITYLLFDKLRSKTKSVSSFLRIYENDRYLIIKN